jgi:hypothetical protein
MNESKINRIMYRVNGGKTINIDHCQVLSEDATHLTVLINGELQRKIDKKKIVENVPIDN